MKPPFRCRLPVLPSPFQTRILHEGEVSVWRSERKQMPPPILGLERANFSRGRGRFQIALLCACLLSGFALPPGAVAQNEWTWTSGSSLPNAPGVYGTLGTPAAGNVPGYRYGASSWTDASGNLWLFGGVGLSSNYLGNLNDLWKFNPATGEWAWIGGSSTINQSGIYGTRGVAAGANVPGARNEASSWTDSKGNFWLFGGEGFDIDGDEGLLNDLWEFNPATNQWTWVAGGAVNDAGGYYGTLGTSGTYTAPGARSGAASWADTSGHFWIFGGGAQNDLWEFDPATAEWTWMGGSSTVPPAGWVPGVYGTLGTPAAGNVPGTRSYAVTWTDSGNLWLFGGLGYGISTSIYEGSLNDLWEFNPSTDEWTWMGGSNVFSSSPQTAQGTYGTLGTPAAGNVPPGRSDAVSWTDTSGNLWLFGGNSESGPNDLVYNDLWVYLPPTNQWTWMGGDQPSLLGPDVYGTLGVYGMLGVPAITNMPGSRQLASSWIDKAGDFWLFGGGFLDASGNRDALNDLWQYQPAAPGAGRPMAQLAPNIIAFPGEEVNTSSTAIKITLSNTGTATLTGIVISLTGPNPSDFALKPAPTCGTSLGTGSSCFIYVTFTPAAATIYAATLSVADNASGSPQTVALTGTGELAAVHVVDNETIHVIDHEAEVQAVSITDNETIHVIDHESELLAALIVDNETIHVIDAPSTLLSTTGTLHFAPSSGNFGSIALGDISPVISFLVTNDTTSTMGYLGYTNLGEFYLQPGTCHLVNGEPMLKPGKSCVFTAVFKPTKAGPVSGNLSIQTSSGTFNVPMTGTGSTQ